MNVLLMILVYLLIFTLAMLVLAQVIKWAVREGSIEAATAERKRLAKAAEPST